MGKKRTFSKEFKLEILQELETKSAAEVCRQHNLHSVLINRWKREYNSNPKEAFSGKGKTWKDDAKLAQAERKIGQQAMEIDLLKKTLNCLQERRIEEKKMRLKES